MWVLILDPSGTGTTGIFLADISDCFVIYSYKFDKIKSGEWKEHLKSLMELVKEKKPEIIVYEDTTYIYGRQHQGTVGLYKLIGGIVGLEYSFDFIKKIESLTVNTIKAFKNKLFEGKEKMEGLTCEVGRGKGWKYKNEKISLHQLDALIIYHLWSGGSLESREIVKQKIIKLKSKKRLGVRQQEQLNKLEKIIANE